MQHVPLDIIALLLGLPALLNRVQQEHIIHTQVLRHLHLVYNALLASTVQQLERKFVRTVLLEAIVLNLEPPLILIVQQEHISQTLAPLHLQIVRYAPLARIVQGVDGQLVISVLMERIQIRLGQLGARTVRQERMIQMRVPLQFKLV